MATEKTLPPALPALHQWQEQQARERLAERQAVLKENQKARAELALKAPALSQRVTEAAAAEAQARAALRAAIEEHQRAATLLYGEVSTVDFACARRERTLALGVPPETAALLEKFDDEMQALWQKQRRYAFRSEARETGSWLPFQNRAETTPWNNALSLRRQLVAISEARRVARQELPLLADVSPAAITVRLDELRKSIPTTALEKVVAA